MYPVGYMVISMLSEKDAEQLAIKAFKTTQFYKWFYDKHGVNPEEASYDELPILQRKDIFEYEKQTGKPHHGVITPHRDLIRLETSGSTGEPFRVLYTREGWIAGYEILHSGFEKFGLKRKIFTYHSLPLEKMIVPLMNAWGLKTAFVSQAEMYDIELIRKLIKTEKPDVIYDATGRWISYLLKNGLPLGKVSVKACLVMQASRRDIEGFHRACLNLLFFLPSTDLGCIACSCPYSESLHVAQESLFHVFGEKGLQWDGEGELVATFPFSVFPLIKYTNNDIVRLRRAKCECGYVGRFLEFIARSFQVKVPDVEGWYIDVDKVYREFARRFRRPILMMFLTAKIKEEAKAVDMLVTFIENDDVSEPSLRTNISNDVVEIGTGKFLPDLVRALPVILIPRGKIPYIDERAPKPRTFIDVRRAPLRKDYLELLKIFEQLTSAQVKL